MGEKQALIFLGQKKYQILESNWRCGSDEVDIIALDSQRQEIVFVEVKTRANDILGDPSLAVDERKLQALSRLAESYIKSKKLTQDYRFDIITINNQQLKHYENVSFLFS